METDSFKRQYADILQRYLCGISYQKLSCQYDPSIEEAVVQHFRNLNFPNDFVKRIMPIIHASAWIATSTYSFTPRHVQEAIAVYTSLAVAIEDTSKESTHDLKRFQQRLFNRQPQPNFLLQAMVDCLVSLRGIYGPFICDMIAKSTAEYISVCAFEAKYDGTLRPTPSSPDFPYYLRLKTGVAEVYAFFAFPEVLYPEEAFLHVYILAVPDISRYFNLGNDLLSFYKESIVADERLNYIYNCSRVSNSTPLESIWSTHLALITCVENIRKTLSASPQMRRNIDQLINGYVMYHFGASRYKLADLGIQEVDELRAKVCCSTTVDNGVGVYKH
ncbi:putative trichodiene synthase [Metarhizium anisopliae]